MLQVSPAAEPKVQLHRDSTSATKQWLGVPGYCMKIFYKAAHSKTKATLMGMNGFTVITKLSR